MNNPNKFTKYYPLFLGNGNNQIGTLKVDYTIVRHDDIQTINSSVTKLNTKRQFKVFCTQRIIINNSLGIETNPDKVNSYENYPAYLNSSIILEDIDNNTIIEQNIIDYSPKTINTKIQSSGSKSDSTGSSAGSSLNSTVGSSTSQSNSYGASVTLSESPESLGASETATYDHSSSNTQDHSTARGTNSSSSKNHDSTDSDSMSIKDWGIYSVINSLKKSPTWIMGQEYPWDIIECGKSSASSATNNPNNNEQKSILISKAMEQRLYDGVFVYPPSQLSQFGLNFVMKSAWIISLDESISSIVRINHNIFYLSASHSLNNKKVSVYIDSSSTLLQQKDNNGNIYLDIDFSILSLDVLGNNKKPAIIGFIPNKFTVLPKTSPLKIVSDSNTLLIDDTTKYGASYPTTPIFSSSETSLTATISSVNPTLSLYFKIIDSINNYKIYIKHWIANSEGVRLVFTINEDTTTQITKYVTSEEAEGGEDNLLAISLRNLDFSSIEYHDYLKLGLNSLQIEIQSIDATKTSIYNIRAISIEKG